jgi:hypothetical protein
MLMALLAPGGTPEALLTMQSMSYLSCTVDNAENADGLRQHPAGPELYGMRSMPTVRCTHGHAEYADGQLALRQ